MIFIYIGMLLSFLQNGMNASILEYSNTSNGVESVGQTGRPIIQYYSPSDYGAGSINDHMIQTLDGTVFFANEKGLLSFNGKDWQLLKINGGRRVRSLKYVENGRIYIGAFNEIGYLEKEKNGPYKYYSISDSLKGDEKSFGTIWQIEIFEGDVFFRAKEKIFRYVDKKLHAIVHQYLHNFNYMFMAGNQIYVSSRSNGIFELNGTRFADKLAGNTDFFSKEIIYLVSSVGRNKNIIVTSPGGFHLSEGKKIKKLSTAASKEINKYSLISASRIGKNRFALSTYKGLILTDLEGNILSRFNNENGLENETVTYAMVDKNANLWICSANGIYRVKDHTAIRVIDQYYGLDGIITDIVYHKNKLVVATLKGLYSLDNERGVVKEKYGNFAVSDLISQGNTLYFSGNRGVYSYLDKEKSILPAISVKQMRFNKALYFIYDFSSALRRYDYDSGIIHMDGRILQNKIMKNFRFDSTGGILMLSKDARLLYLDKEGIDTGKETETLEINRLNHESVNLIKIDENVFVAVADRLYRFIPERRIFQVEEELNRFLKNKAYSITNLIKGHKDHFWLLYEENNRSRVRLIKKEKREYKWVQRYDSYLKNLNVKKIIPLSDSLVCLADQQKIYMLNLKAFSVISELDKPKVYQVSLNKDSLIYPDSEAFVYNFNSGTKEITFHYLVPDYDQSISYQYQLQGFNEKWSGWSKETKRTFTNLSPGEYLFRVKANSVQNQKSDIYELNFLIEKPWYMKKWAYIFFLAILFFLIYIIVKFYTKKLKNEKLVLEKLIKERTRELEEKAEYLKELDKAKSNFFANISHEFRTPLTLIKSPVEQLLKKADTGSKESLKLVKKQSDVLLRNINQLLDLTKLQNNELSLDLNEDNIVLFIEELADSFQNEIKSKELNLKFNSEFQNFDMAFDPEKLEKIIYNLLSNAIKFTKKGGLIVTSLKKQNESFIIEISDTGIGIAKSRQQLIFERFYQIENDLTRQYDGTGIGMAVVKDFTDLHGGTISVESEEGKGSRFLISLPIKHVQQKVVNTKTKSAGSFSANGFNKENKSSKDLLLIVEDHNELREYLDRNLAVSFKVISAKDGKEALRLAMTELPDIILSDVMIPEISGIDLLKHIRKNDETSHIPILLLTAKSQAEDKIKGLELGASDYISKPFNIDEVHLKLKNLIQDRQHYKEKIKKSLVEEELSDDSKKLKKESFIEKAEKIVLHHIENFSFSPDELAKELSVSRSVLYRKITAVTDLSASIFIRLIRLREAKKIIASEDLTMSEVAFKTGFKTLSYFTKCFKDEFGFSPSEYKKRNIN